MPGCCKASAGPGCGRAKLRTSQNWIGPRGCTLNQACVRSAAAPRGAERAGRAGDLSPQPQRAAGAGPGRAGPRPVRDHPSVSGWERPRWPAAHHVFAVPAGHPAAAGALPLHFFRQRRGEYYERLQAVRDCGDWEGWLAFFLRGAAEVSAGAAETIRRILSLREEHRILVMERLGRAAADGYRVLDRLYRQPFLSVADVLGITGTNYPGRQPPGRPAGRDRGAGGNHRRPTQPRVPLQPLYAGPGRRGAVTSGPQAWASDAAGGVHVGSGVRTPTASLVCCRGLTNGSGGEAGARGAST